MKRGGAGLKKTAKPSRVAILDAGAQYGKVIDRRVRGLMIESDVFDLDTRYEALAGYDALILSGGPESVYEKGSPQPDPAIWQSGKPILGICYGMQLINHAFGGDFRKHPEFGQRQLELKPSRLFDQLGPTQTVLMTHNDNVARLAPGFKAIGRSGGEVAAMADEGRRIYGVQFHPEVDLTENGTLMLSNFLFGIAGLTPAKHLADSRASTIQHIRERVGDRQVLVFASGGVDSTVLAVLAAEALRPEQINVVHVDTGFMRAGESTSVKRAMATAGVQLRVIKAQEQFLQARAVVDGQPTAPLSKISDPELKRRIIGDTFMNVLEQAIAELKLDPENTVLAQGTLRPDLIESASHLASAKAAVIKTHHNDTELVRRLRAKGRVVEPLQELHKDQVRELGEQLGLPEELVWRQPFPGPGLAIRLLCASEPYMTKDFDDIERRLQDFNTDYLSAHLLPIRTVGVQGDGRSYSYIAALSGPADWPRLFKAALDIPAKLPEVNRVIYVFGGRLTGRQHGITPTLPTADAIEQLRQADHAANGVLRRHGLLHRLSQVPIVSFPAPFGETGKRSIGIRAFMTSDFMTGLPAEPGKDMPLAALDEIVTQILKVPGIARVAYDLTPKPPATTEWE